MKEGASGTAGGTLNKKIVRIEASDWQSSKRQRQVIEDRWLPFRSAIQFMKTGRCLKALSD
jgi:hypothetical protein